MTDPHLYEDLEARGILKQITSPLLKSALEKEPLTLYCGFDPSSDSLHVGSLLPLLTLRRFQLAGHRVIAVVGGATGMIGDPSFKATERSILTRDQLQHNLKGIQSVIEKFLDLGGHIPARIANNADWFEGLSSIDFLRDVGKHFTINHMMAKESVRARLEDREHGISYTEFSYMLLQAYDFHILNERENCRLQIGGSDQWGNITAGIELIRRMRAHFEDATSEPTAEEDTVFGLTHPLVTKADGTKFGKTETGTVWLSSARTSPYAFFQFWIQTPDADIGKYLRFFSFKSLREIEELEDSAKIHPEKREAQTALAREMIELVHGREALETAELATQVLFGGDPTKASAAVWSELMTAVPTHALPKARLQSGLALVDALAESGLCPSKGQARKDIQGGGISVNNQKVAEQALLLGDIHLLAGAYVLLRKGKKNYCVLSFSG